MTFLHHPVMCNAWSQLLLHASISQTLSELINSTFEMKFQPLFGICINRIYLCSVSNLCWKYVDFKYIACKWQLQAYVSILWTVSELHELYLHSLQDESPACYMAYVSTRYVSFSSSKQPWKFVYFKWHDCRNSSHSRLCSGISKPPTERLMNRKCTYQLCLVTMFKDKTDIWIYLHTSSGSISCVTAEPSPPFPNLLASSVLSIVPSSLASVCTSFLFTLVKLKLRFCAASSNCKYNTPKSNYQHLTQWVPDILSNKNTPFTSVFNHASPKMCSCSLTNHN